MDISDQILTRATRLSYKKKPRRLGESQSQSGCVDKEVYLAPCRNLTVVIQPAANHFDVIVLWRLQWGECIE
jgi:hypothetical protein